ncbi:MULTISPECIES: hypothetical protein [Fictibacillus]|uniref:hypothetical protein n=1 Tax=Fictibacillus TaxID=1329200 RepID=UPI0018CF0EC8|nr:MULTISPECIES: hypothetical protein [unclassified Fictibacillus]MBH0155053.1 hypothetical protein [Fictibacillus sp. 5RED26]MBH0162399.1 hypothetical protein [Fictibacillus sp. 26RED30]MBH0165164.1 hypothetical protein [Fictibacillus sp. 7GRE50]MBH0172243.1 hypothetical protein [Fictibacillus sp. 23RED33]
MGKKRKELLEAFNSLDANGTETEAEVTAENGAEAGTVEALRSLLGDGLKRKKSKKGPAVKSKKSSKKCKQSNGNDSGENGTGGSGSAPDSCWE